MNNIYGTHTTAGLSSLLPFCQILLAVPLLVTLFFAEETLNIGSDTTFGLSKCVSLTGIHGLALLWSHVGLKPKCNATQRKLLIHPGQFGSQSSTS